jgi:hypothetical protein
MCSLDRLESISRCCDEMELIRQEAHAGIWPNALWNSIGQLDWWDELHRILYEPYRKKIWKAYETHMDFCEQCAMYEQGDPVDPCIVSQLLWSCFYQHGYPAVDKERNTP